MTLAEVIIEIGDEDYMTIIRRGDSPKEYAYEAGYDQCDVCHDWMVRSDFFVTDGQIGCNVCEYCYDNKLQNKIVMLAQTWRDKYY